MLNYIHLPGVRTPGVRTGRISRDQFLSQLDHRNWSIITDDLGILSAIFHRQEIFNKKNKNKNLTAISERCEPVDDGDGDDGEV